MARDAIVITGPTASGKTAVAVAVAQRVSGEVISIDSRQVYRLLDIGTAKPAVAERGGIPHHGFDLVEPNERFSAGRFATLARTWLAQIAQRGNVPVIAGGTGFFLRALTHPLFDEPPLDAALKESWKQYLGGQPTEELVRWAAQLDPEANVRPEDRQRLARLIETAVLTGRPLSWWHRQPPISEPAIDPLVCVLDLPRQLLYERIEQRVDDMIAAGLDAEVRALVERGYGENDPGMNATGYIELLAYVRGECELAEAVELIKRATRRYARRQLTWLRNQLPGDALWLDGTRPRATVVADIVRAWDEVKR